jgi:S-DNA-T family DNA segregation ATPase FtsK/SpoIIIE
LDLFALIIISILFGFFATSLPELGGTVGYELNLFLQDYIGKTGTLLVLHFWTNHFVIFKIKMSQKEFSHFSKTPKKKSNQIWVQIQMLKAKLPIILKKFAITEEGT